MVKWTCQLIKKPGFLLLLFSKEEPTSVLVWSPRTSIPEMENVYVLKSYVISAN